MRIEAADAFLATALEPQEIEQGVQSDQRSRTLVLRIRLAIANRNFTVMPLLGALHNPAGLVVAGSYLLSRLPLRRLPAEASISLQQRLVDLPTQHVPMRRKVQIY